jgi:hypothetical protein
MAITLGRLSVLSAAPSHVALEESLPHEQLMLTVLPMSGHIGTRFIQMNMLVYMIYPRKRDEVMVLPVW